MGLFLAVVLAYIPVWWAGYVWDDDDLVTGNPCVVGPLGLTEIWTTSAAQFYPLVVTTCWLGHKLWGLEPLPYHLLNVVFHDSAALVLWRVLTRLGIPGAWLGAALWALHPVQVESVAWISEMKNTESGLFFLLSILFYARWLKPSPEARRDYLLCLLFAALAMSAKSSTVILPLVLALCAWWMDRGWRWSRLWSTVPVFMMSAISTALVLWAVHQQDVNGSPLLSGRSWPDRLATAGDAFWFYLGKLAWPQPLMAMYPRWKIDTGSPASYLPLAAMIGVLGLLWFTRKSWGRAFFFALGYYAVALLPVLGLVNHYFLRYTFVADHFQYLAGIGPLALAGAGLARLVGRLPAHWICHAGTAALLAVYGVLSWNRAWVYESSEILWTTTLAQDPDSWPSHDNLGNTYSSMGRYAEAIVHFRMAAEINPQDAPALTNLGLVLCYAGQAEDGVAQLRRAVDIEPYLAVLHYNLATGLTQQKRTPEAIVELNKALVLDPKYSDARNNLGTALLQLSRTDEALAEFQKTVELDPASAKAVNNIGLIDLRAGRYADAEVQFRRAAELDPANDTIHLNLGNALVRLGRIADAVAEYQKAVDQNPGNAEAQNNLAGAHALLRNAK